MGPVLWIVLAALGAAIVGLASGLAFVVRRLSRLERRHQRLVTGMEGENLEGILNQHLDQVRLVMPEIETLRSRNETLQLMLRTALRHVGLVRFNPFADTGGDYSFAVALADDEGNGFILYNLHGRGDSRLYVKPLQGWASPYALADEEKEAIRHAQLGETGGQPAAPGAPASAARSNTTDRRSRQR